MGSPQICIHTDLCKNRVFCGIAAVLYRGEMSTIANAIHLYFGGHTVHWWKPITKKRMYLPHVTCNIYLVSGRYINCEIGQTTNTVVHYVILYETLLMNTVSHTVTGNSCKSYSLSCFYINKISNFGNHIMAAHGIINLLTRLLSLNFIL